MAELHINFEPVAGKHYPLLKRWPTNCHQLLNSCRHSREGGNPTLPAKWNREWKVNMIEAFNPNWIDLHDDIDPTVFYDESKLDSRLRGNDGYKAR